MASAVDKAYVFIRAAIVSGKYPPGMRLTEIESVETTGVSRTPVREALRRLHAEGLVVLSPNQGAIVAKLTDDDVTDIYHLRAELESYAVRRAIEFITPEEIEDLRSLAMQSLNEVKQKRVGYVMRAETANLSFHQLLLQISRSDRLKSFCSQLMEIPTSDRDYMICNDKDLVEVANCHLELVDLIAGKKVEEAVALMHKHINNVHVVLHDQMYGDEPDHSHETDKESKG